jgi:hypothetical protein
MAARKDLDLSRAAWRTSTFSNNGGECVETGQAQGAVLVRDTEQHGHGRVHRFTAAEWREFIARIKANETAR